MAKKNYEEKDDEKVYSKNGKKQNGKRSNKRYNKSKSKDKTVCETEDAKSDRYLNDASWYIPNDELRAQAASYPMNVFLGTPLEIKYDAETQTIAQKLPTVMGIKVNPSVGRTAIDLGGSVYEQQAAINATARKWYNMLSANTGRTANYSPDDIAIIIAAMSELVSTVAQAFRAYGLAFNYSLRNRSIPKSLIGATGMDPDSLLDNMAQFRMKLNTLLIQANALPIPADIKIFEKNWNLFSRAFVDETSAMAQYYVISEYSTWRLDERSGSTGSILKTHYLDNTEGSSHVLNYTYTATGLLKTIETQILNLQMASSYNMVFADIMNLLEKQGGKLYQFGYLPELYVVAPEFSEEMLTQIHNLTTTGIPNTTIPTGDIYATPENDVIADVTTGIVHFNPTFKFRTASHSHEPVLDFPFTDNPSVDDKINAMRYTSMFNTLSVGGTAPTDTGNEVTLPDKYVVGFAIMNDDDIHLSDATTLIQAPSITINTMSAGQMLLDVMAFRHHPIIYVATATAFVGALTEFNFCTALTFDYLKRVNDLSMYGLFDYPY